MAVYAKAAGAFLYVAVKLDRGENRLELLGDGGAINIEDGCRLLFLAAEYGEQGIDLRLVRIGIEEPAYDAAALMHGSRPAIDGSNLEPIEPQIAEPSLFDKHAFKTFAQALGRLAVEFARAAVIATARCYLGALDPPINIGHGNTPIVPGKAECIRYCFDRPGTP